MKPTFLYSGNSIVIFLSLLKIFKIKSFLFISILIFSLNVHAVGTPEGWQPKNFKAISKIIDGKNISKKVYEFWGGAIGGDFFLADSAQISSEYYCDIVSNNSSAGVTVVPILGSFNVDAVPPGSRYDFGCDLASDPATFLGFGSSAESGFTIQKLHECSSDEKLLFAGNFSVKPAFKCVDDIPKNCTTSNRVGKPCHVPTGTKFRNETDFSYGGFTFTRNYHSLNLVNIGFGMGWHNKYLKGLSVSGDAIAVYEGTGRGEPWTKVNGVWVGDADSDYLITESASGYTVTLKRGDIHEHDLSGRLLSETDTQGKVKTYEYDAEDRLIKVSNHYQQSITFTYSTDGKNHITKVVDAQGIEYGYEYDANDNLTAVVYPDGDSDPANNPKRLYHYEDTNFPNHITGITNANGERYATFAYDATGKAIESALAPTTNSVGQQRVQLNYQGVN